MNPVLPATIIDSHVHLWDPLNGAPDSGGAAELYQDDPETALRAFAEHTPLQHRAIVLAPETMFGAYLPANLTLDSIVPGEPAFSPVTGLIHVQSGRAWADPVAETAWLSTLPEQSSGAGVVGIVALADPRSPDVPDLLDRHAEASGRLRGIRLMTTWHPDPGVVSAAEAPGTLSSAKFLNGFAAVAERGLSFDTWVYSHQIEDVVRLAREYPQTTVILDHLATPVGAFGPFGQGTGSTTQRRAQILAQWREGMAEAAAEPNVVAKASGIAFPALGFNAHQDLSALQDLVGPLVEEALQQFGDDRVMFGSNYPIDRPVASYVDLVRIVADVAAARDRAAVEKVFSSNAFRVYGGG
ncbi:putative TIM-barrel fold metal-dependent hydrolase [Nocardioides ginsengisegetis]|uniref:Putative TIM-barrel fold metal-dependent hydrolase n=1 Tax=Nocardioides ginsengisegetis TaxID=661491 RepID=A0A7W3J290_9ACTN|nr:amidohydrolase family protein [Nocardioides ginsengisegetis]MBA8804889.1 putative TIM-barrel fold metal-dependent hydrolase [Nocardioides ginsengisegetis]